MTTEPLRLTRRSRVRPLGSLARGGMPFVCLAALLTLTPTAAWAGDGGTTTENGSASVSPELLVPRYLPGGGDAGAPSHLNNFTPAALNYEDCVSAIDLAFTLDLSGVSSDDEIQVWAGTGTADCTQPAARQGSSTDPDEFPGLCWPVAPSTAFDPTASTTTARIHARDLVAYIGQGTAPTTYPTSGYSVTATSGVCQPYATHGAVGLNIYFIPVPAGSTNLPPDGISGLYRTSAALVGPFAPVDVQVPNTGITSNSLTVYWEPQSESVIQGYNIYLQDQGTSDAGGGGGVDASSVIAPGVECHPKLTCSVGTPDAGSSDGGTDAGTDAHTTGSVDATLDAGGSVVCDAGYSDAWVAIDAKPYLGEDEAGLAAEHCEYTYGKNAQSPVVEGGTTCTSRVLYSTFLVDGGLGSVAVASSTDGSTSVNGFVDSGEGLDAGIDADADANGTTTTTTTTTTSTGSTQETAGISNISNAYFNYYVSGTAASSYTINGLTTGHHYAIAVAAVDSYGNVGPIGPLGCSIPTDVDDFFTQYALDGGQAGGGFCSVNGMGASAFSFFGVIGTAAGALAFIRRRRTRHARRSR